MPAPVPVTTLLPPKPTPQSELSYAPARPAGLSSLIDHLGPGYVVVKLGPPSMRLETLRLAGLLTLSGVFLAALGLAPKLLTPGDRSGGVHVEDLMMMGGLAVPLAALIVFAAMAVAQGRRVLRRLLRPAPPAGSITFRRAEALTDARNAHTVLRVMVKSPGFGIASAYLRIETPTGQVLELLRGHSVSALGKLAYDLRAHLLAPRSPAPKAREVS